MLVLWGSLRGVQYGSPEDRRSLFASAFSLAMRKLEVETARAEKRLVVWR